jgi:hypothetical protein
MLGVDPKLQAGSRALMAIQKEVSMDSRFFSKWERPRGYRCPQASVRSLPMGRGSVKQLQQLSSLGR